MIRWLRSLKTRLIAALSACMDLELIGSGDTIYLRRWRIQLPFGCRLFLHCFHRDDPDAMHCHPWNFVSLIMGPGYYEETVRGRFWRSPLSVLFRRANHRHRIALDHGRRCWTLVVTGPNARSWGFYPDGTFVPARTFFLSQRRQEIKSEKIKNSACNATVS